MSVRVRNLMMVLLTGLLAGDTIHVEAAEEIVSVETSAQTLSLNQAIILGIVEGATEYLPVSSTGHLLIAEHLMGMHGSVQQKKAADSLAICIQLGAILAVLVLYRHRFQQMLAGLMGRNRDGLQLFINLIVAVIPAIIIGKLFGEKIKEQLFGVLPVAIALFVGGVLILLQSWGRKRYDDAFGKEMHDICWRCALFVGVMQCLAFWPGFSRSLATILGCRIAKLRMMVAVEFSFLLGFVTLSAATAKETLDNGKEMLAAYGTSMPLIALVVAFVAAAVSIRFMLGFLGRFGLAPFGYYRILLAIACICWLYR